MKTLIVLFLLIVPAISFSRQAGTRLALQTQITRQSVSLRSDSAMLPVVPFRRAYSAVNLGGQVLLGATFSALLSIPSLYAASLAMWNDNSVEGEIGLSLIFLSSYSFGTAVGVHAIAGEENPRHSLWETWMYSAIGTGVAVGSAFVLGGIYGPLPGGAMVLFACPLAGSMVYSLFIADWPINDGIATLQRLRTVSAPRPFAGIRPAADFSVNLFSLEF